MSQRRGYGDGNRGGSDLNAASKVEECWLPPEAGVGEETGFSPRTSRRNSALSTP